jgi:hypothetical protein
MKYILMMNCPKTGYDTIGAWPKQDIQAHIGFMMGFNKALSEAGELVSAEGLASPHEAKVVRAGKDGAPVTDGVFPEAKEFLAGYWIVDVESPEQAYRIAARASAAPGPGGAPMNMPIEVRQVMSGPPDDLL